MLSTAVAAEFTTHNYSARRRGWRWGSAPLLAGQLATSIFIIYLLARGSGVGRNGLYLGRQRALAAGQRAFGAAEHNATVHLVIVFAATYIVGAVWVELTSGHNLIVRMVGEKSGKGS